MFNLNKELAVKCVKTIIDCNRCLVCDQLNEPCVRYPCGHLICEKCVLIEESCYVCLSQPENFKHNLDEPYSLRVKHAFDLVTTFEDAFHLDVNTSSRISDQLKLEKELFPKCIQAPIKYSNKQKSLKPKKILSPVSVLKGENTHKRNLEMDNKFEYVQKWLNNTEQSTSKPFREPLRDLNVSQIGLSNRISHNIRNTATSTLNKKRKYTTAFKNEKFKKTFTKRNRKSFAPENNTYLYSKIEDSDNNDSGIIIDENHSIIDKDKLACMAVIEAELKENKGHTIDFKDDKQLIETTEAATTSETNNIYKINKIIFNKRSPLLETCRLCKDFNAHVRAIAEKKTQPKTVNITVDSNSFIATISISNNGKSFTKESSMKSVPVQTNVTYFNEVVHNTTKELSQNCVEEINLKKTDMENETLKIDSGFEITDINLHTEVNNMSKLNENSKKGDKEVLPKFTIVEDSDSSNLDEFSDIDDNTLNVIEVTAEVHQSCSHEDYVLKSLHESEYENRTRKAARGNTPESTNSSEKENFDPNRIRKTTTSQKKCDKK